MDQKPERTYSIKEVAEYTGIREQTLRLWLHPRDKNKKPRLQGEKKGKEWWIREGDVINLVNERNPHKTSSAINLIEKCRSELLIMGINSLGPLHSGRELILECLKNGVNVKILLLDPDCNGFLFQSMREETTKEGIRSGRLLAELKASLAICDDINNFFTAYKNENPDKKSGSIEVRFRDEHPIKALVIIDPEDPINAECDVKYYPQDTDSGEPIRSGESWINNRLPITPRNTDLFITHVKDFHRLWSKSVEFKYNINGVPLQENIKCLLATLKQPFKKAKFLEVGESHELQIKHEDILLLQRESPAEYELLKIYIARGLAREV